jgi:hypothetical protein
MKIYGKAISQHLTICIVTLNLLVYIPLYTKLNSKLDIWGHVHQGHLCIFNLTYSKMLMKYMLTQSKSQHPGE